MITKLLITLFILVAVIGIILITRDTEKDETLKTAREIHKKAIADKLHFLYQEAEQELFEYREKMSNAQEYEKPTIEYNHREYLRELRFKTDYLEKEIKKL